MQLSDFTPGMRVWHGRKMGTVIKPAVKRVHVSIGGKVKAIPPGELQPETCTRLHTTRTYSHFTPKPPNSRRRRAMRNGYARVS